MWPQYTSKDTCFRKFLTAFKQAFEDIVNIRPFVRLKSSTKRMEWVTKETFKLFEVLSNVRETNWNKL